MSSQAFRKTELLEVVELRSTFSWLRPEFHSQLLGAAFGF